MRLLGQWNFSVSYGVPVGPAVTRILAELAINDVDHALLDEGIDFCRFSDDYRIFAESERDAFRALAVLADCLQESHGLTLSERKTDIMRCERFVARHIDGVRPGEAAQLADRVARILESHGHAEDKYAALDMDELPEQLVKELDELDLNSVLRDEITDHRMFDTFAVSISLRRLAQLRDATLLDVVIDNLDLLTPVMPQVINFIRKVTPADRRRDVGAKLLATIELGRSSHSQYQATWLLSLFTDDASWNNREALVKLLTEVTDDVSKPMLLQALGVASNPHWFRRHRRELQSLSGWQRRAFMRGAMCLGKDEYVHWVKSVLPRLDLLDQSVARYCLSSM
jgi:hypothetical protein